MAYTEPRWLRELREYLDSATLDLSSEDYHAREEYLLRTFAWLTNRIYAILTAACGAQALAARAQSALDISRRVAEKLEYNPHPGYVFPHAATLAADALIYERVFGDWRYIPTTDDDMDRYRVEFECRVCDVAMLGRAFVAIAVLYEAEDGASILAELVGASVEG